MNKGLEKIQAERAARNDALGKRKNAAARILQRRHPEGRVAASIYVQPSGSMSVPVYFDVTSDEIDAELAEQAAKETIE